ncbi:hypothetical protein SCUCBS95973_004028 [Sporothrix curviconia]|uniref:SHSP domain-containing protein n=1 Tax=Sporothrix curviconia TaxID=1260050 RepID=A0ABP0BKA4_9PEZI
MSEPNFPPNPWGPGVNMAFRPGPPGPPPHHGRYHPHHFHHGPPLPPPAPPAATGPEVALLTNGSEDNVATEVNDPNPATEKSADNNNNNNNDDDNDDEGGRRRGGRHGRHHHWGGRHADWEAYAATGMPWGGPWAAGPHGFGGGRHGHRHHHGHEEDGFGEFGFSHGQGRHGHFHGYGHGHHGHHGRWGYGGEDGAANVTDEEQNGRAEGRGFGGRHGGRHHGYGGRRGGFGRWGWDDIDNATVTGSEAVETADAKFGSEDVTTSTSSSSESEEDITMIEKDDSPSTARGETSATGAPAGAAPAAVANNDQEAGHFQGRGFGRGWGHGRHGPRGWGAPSDCETCEEYRSARCAARAARHAARAAARASATADAKEGEDGGDAPPVEPGVPSDGERRRGYHGRRHGRHARAHDFHGYFGPHGPGNFFPGHGPWARGDFFDASFGPGGPHFSHHRFGPYGPFGGPAGPHGGHHHGRHGGRRGGPPGAFGHGGAFGPDGPFGPGGPFGPDGPIGRHFGPNGVGRRSFGPMMAALANHPVARNLRAYFGDVAAPDATTRGTAADNVDATATGDDADHFSPPVDIFVDDNRGGWILHVALPGANKEDIDVQWDADRGLLTIAGVVVRPGDEAFLEGLINAERRVGLFQREVRLPPFGAEADSNSAAAKQEVDAVGITARMENGVLIVTVPTVDKEWTEVRQVDIE